MRGNVRRHSVRDECAPRMRIDLREKILIHERAVGLRMRARQAHVFIQIESRRAGEIQSASTMPRD